MNWVEIQTEWRTWWKSIGTIKRWAPAILSLVYWLVLNRLGGLRTDLFLSSLVPTLLYYAGPRLRPFFQFLLPLCLVSIVYDSQRYYSDYIRGPIHVREPYAFDKRFFGVPTSEGRLTPNEWWQKHTYGFLDFITGLAYIVFIPVFLICVGYFRFWLSRTGTAICSARSILYRAPQIMWVFFWLNVLGYSTYYWYAAAPPWYVALYGLGPANLSVQANLAGCARFDQLLGIPIFHGWYGKSADVFGAIPSLHVSYPLVATYYAFRFGALRTVTLSFYLLMCFSAVYLNHHYVLDVLWGSGYALLVSFCFDLLWNRKLKKSGIVVPGSFSGDFVSQA